MLSLVEADQPRFWIQDELGNRAIVHHAIPAAVVIVEEQAEDDGESSSMADDDDTLARVTISDSTQSACQTIADLSRRFAAMRAIVVIGTHVMEEFLVLEEMVEGQTFPFAEIVFGQVGIDLRC